jgi:hypothetical protein
MTTEFHRNINNLSTGKKPGPDNIPNEILITAPPLLKTCLHLLAQIFWATGCTPDRWKDSHTVLLFKNKGTILDLKLLQAYRTGEHAIQTMDQTGPEHHGHICRETLHTQPSSKGASEHTETQYTSLRPTP